METTITLTTTANAELIQTTNYTGQYTLPELPGWLTKILTFDTWKGTHTIFRVADLDPQNIMDYIRDTLLPYLQDIQNNLSGDDDYFDYGPSLKDEALELLSGLYHGKTQDPYYQKYLEAINIIMPDPEC